MNNKQECILSLKQLKLDNIIKQKKGIHFIIASVPFWIYVCFIQMLNISVLGKNLYTFLGSPILVLLAYFISRLIRIDFKNKENPLSILGLIFTLNQILYIFIVMWVYSAVPEKMLMVYAMIFGAHLLPYGWLYESKIYYIFSIFITISVLLLGLKFEALYIAIFMVLAEFIFSICVTAENSKIKI